MQCAGKIDPDINCTFHRSYYFSHSHPFLGYVQDGIFCHFLASMFSGLVTTIASMPVDIAKTRIQSMKIVDGKPEYKGAVDVIVKVARNEGFFSLWKGFTPYYFRLGPHTVLTFIFLEQMNRLYKVNVLGIKDAKGGGL